ncbi:hypothetical protein M947_06080 [Sulfurimonas hongkongensis]|uniref:Uncharacterized protein n=1 Tax=Sulfurimonas hongkongensis TaxID=1172190 RepID=T0JRR9_9BACT|nr:hypothetical protein [Sulfurimonas hongkongensis]EQB39557.1 hypothetical protein M947_06080 [Sulfurimonas hongkongensis]
MLNPKTYYYVHTGHRIGLDRFRRACTIMRLLKDVDITLLCSDYRIAQIASEFGVKKSVGVDVVRNIPQIANHGDRLIFDSSEANPNMLQDMRAYFSRFVRISDDANDKKEEDEFLISPYLEGEGILNTLVIDEKYFINEEKIIDISFFFGDDDYDKQLEKNLSLLDGVDVDLLLGFYYFFDYEDMLKEKFERHYEFEEYDDVIKKSKILITSSHQAVLENLASGGKPIFVQREDYPEDFLEIFKKLNIPIVQNYQNSQLLTILKARKIHEYYKVEHNNKKLVDFLKVSLNL